MPPPRLTSYTAMMLGWDSMATAWDSSWNRRRNSASSLRSFFSIFTATRRLSRWSFALNTTAMPPVPMTSRIS